MLKNTMEVMTGFGMNCINKMIICNPLSILFRNRKCRCNSDWQNIKIILSLHLDSCSQMAFYVMVFL